jgi:hypothetical protein
LSIDDDFDCDELISRLVGPLSPPDRIAFRRAAEEALARAPAGVRLSCTERLPLCSGRSSVRE